MHRQFFSIAFAFLAGILAGALATGGHWPATESSEDAPQFASVASGKPPGAAAADSPSMESSSPAAALGAALREAAPTQAITPEPGADLDSTLQAMTESWMGLRGDVARLQGRLDGLERRLAALTAPTAAADDAARPVRSDKPEDRRAALLKAGVAEDRAAEIIWRQGQQELEQLELRDLATREGWFGSDRFREEMARVREDSVDLRTEIGADSYDRYLFASGEDNRVEIGSIIPGSVADESGLEPGDLVETYGDARVFSFRDLRGATTEGARGELVPVRIRRGDDVVDAWLPRGPLGVRLDRARLDPDS